MTDRVYPLWLDYIHYEHTLQERRSVKRTVDEHLPMTPANYHILLALAGSEQHGYSIMRQIRESTDGRVRVAPATLYRLIAALLRSELIEEFEPAALSYD